MEPFENLTARQAEVYNFIRERIRARGYGPTVREIGSVSDQLAQRRDVSPQGP